MTGRDAILGRIRSATDGRERVPHPGPFEGGRPERASGSAVDRFEAAFAQSGGETVRCSDLAAAAAWLTEFLEGVEDVAVGRGVPPDVMAPSDVRPAAAQVAVSLGRGAVAETGSCVLGSEDGRRCQLLAPTHVVLITESGVHDTLREYLDATRDSLPSAIGLHSGPSKSADIGQILVRGVHGPGRIIALIVSSNALPSGGST